MISVENNEMYVLKQGYPGEREYERVIEGMNLI
jgi:hypothetical protein